MVSFGDHRRQQWKCKQCGWAILLPGFYLSLGISKEQFKSNHGHHWPDSQPWDAWFLALEARGDMHI